MQNVVVNMCEKFRNDRLRNNRSLGNWKSDNNNINTNKNTKNKNNVRSTWGLVSGSNKKINPYVAKFGHNMAKNGHCVLSGVNKTAFSGISTLFYRATQSARYLL